MTKIEDKIITFKKIQEIHRNLETKEIVLVGGCFDVVHFGHITFLSESKNKNKTLVVALESDEFIEKRKNRKPVHTQEQRATLLAHMDIVDYVILLPFMEQYDDYLSLVIQVKPAIIAISEGDPKEVEKRKQAAKLGAIFQVIPFLKSAPSTSKIIEYASIFSD